MFENELKSASIQKFWRLLLIIAPIYICLMLANYNNWYLILGIFFIFCLYVFAKNYLWVLFAIALPALTIGQVLKLEVVPGWYYESSFSEILILSILTVFLADKIINKKIHELKVDIIFFLLLGYLIISLTSFSTIENYKFFVGENKVFIFSLVSYFLALNFLDSYKKVKYLVYAISATVFILAGQLFLKFYQMGFSSEFFLNRSYIILPIGAIALVAAIITLLLPIILSFYYYADKNDKARPFIMISFIAGFVSVFLTMGKGAIISLLVGLFYLLTKMKDKMVLYFLLFFFFIFSGILLLSPFATGLTNRLANAFVDKNTQFRIAEYDVSWKIIKENMIFGVGAGQQPIFFRQEFRDPDFSNYVNNFFLQSQLDFGLIGLAIIIIILLVIVNNLLKQKRILNKQNLLLHYGFVACLVAALLNGLIEVTFFALNYAIIFWIVVGAFSNIYKNNEYENISHNN